MFSYKLVVIQKRVRGVDSIDLVQLPLGEDLGWLETPATGKQTLSAQHFIDTGNATAKLMFSVEDGGIGICRGAKRACRLAVAGTFAGIRSVASW